MRIIDPDHRHDYYDGVQSLGQDRSVVYMRKEARVWSEKSTYEHVFSRYTIGFCGSLYPLVRVGYWDSRKQDNISAWCYTLSDCDRLVDGADEDVRNQYIGKTRRSGRLFRGKRREVERYFSERDNPIRLGCFHKYNTPIIVWEPKRTVVNPLLRPYEFYRVKDSYTAFQELSAYVGGVLLSETKEVPIIPDEIMVEIKGFDKKTSFRKPKSDR